MPKLKHYKTIRLIEKRIEDLNKEIALSEKIMDEPEMMSDYHFAVNDIKNFEAEISELRDTANYLIQ